MKIPTSFCETNPAYDEYVGQVVGIFTKSGFCVAGIGFPHSQLVIVILNIGFGFWYPSDEK